MIRNRPRVVLLAAAMAASLVVPVGGPVAAQEPLTSPEGVDWKLTSYLADDTLTAVPFGTSATLHLEAGQATGSGGCNTFSGTYQLDGASLTFSDQFSTTLKICDEAVQSVEDAYLAALPQVTGWLISEDVLQLSDDSGALILTFEVPNANLTSSDLASLAATLEELRTDVDGLGTDVTQLNIERLRERVKTLETSVASLQAKVADLNASAAANGGNGFTREEAILLEGLPQRIASRCVPLRGNLPKGSAAAVTCKPETSTVTGVDYYLLDGGDAAALFQNTMEAFGVAEAVSATKTCKQGRKSQRIFVGSGWQSEGCYVDNGKAQVRFVDNATECRQLKVGDQRLRAPAVYVSLHGSGSNIARVWDWATRDNSADSSTLTSITKPIARPKEKLSTSCPT